MSNWKENNTYIDYFVIINRLFLVALKKKFKFIIKNPIKKQNYFLINKRFIYANIEREIFPTFLTKNFGNLYKNIYFFQLLFPTVIFNKLYLNEIIR